MMLFLETRNPGFASALAEKLEHDQPTGRAVFETVTSIIDDVRGSGDASLLAYSAQIDGLQVRLRSQTVIFFIISSYFDLELLFIIF